MRVLQLLSSTGFHGAETMAAELVHQLDRLGVSVDVGVLDNSGRGDRTILAATAEHVRAGVVVPCAGQLDWHTLRFLRQHVRAQRISILHSHKYKTTFYALGAKSAGDARVIATYHNWLTDTWPLKVYAALDKGLARFCDAAVGVSRPVTETLKHRLPAEKVLHIGNGVDPEKFKPVVPRAEAKRRLGLPEGPLLGFIGRLTEAKGLTYLLQALQDLPAELRTAQLAIVGDGEYRPALLTEIRDRALADRVHLLGTRRDTPLIYSALDVFVLPSRVEAFPMVVLEAMACGAPVVATTAGDVAHIIVHDACGLTVAPGDAGALAVAITRILADPALAQRFADTGRARVKEKFSSEAMARAYLALYERVLRDRPQR